MWEEAAVLARARTETRRFAGVVGGNCRGYRKPLFQYLVYGNPADGVRDVPDVSLFAGNGVWGHYYVICYSDPTPGFGGTPCVGAPDGWSGGGGTSFAAPILGGIQAIINQTSEPYQGNPDFVYYALAGLEYGFKGNSSCNSTLGNQTSPNCIFYDVTLGDNNVNCLPLVVDGTTLGSFNCYYDGATNGVLSTSTTSYKPAFVTRPAMTIQAASGQSTPTTWRETGREASCGTRGNFLDRSRFTGRPREINSRAPFFCGEA